VKLPSRFLQHLLRQTIASLFKLFDIAECAIILFIVGFCGWWNVISILIGFCRFFGHFDDLLTHLSCLGQLSIMMLVLAPEQTGECFEVGILE